MLPIFFATFGGLLGALVAVITIIADFRVAGSGLSTGAKSGVMIAVAAAAHLVWLVSAGIFAAVI